jgi:transcriptional regulator with XRE-family HTH domain
MDDTLQFGQLLRRFRLRTGRTQEQFAHDSGLSPSTVQSYESGRRYPEPPALERLQRALALDLEELARFRTALGQQPPETGLTAAWHKARGAPNTVWDEVQGCDWISMVINERREIVAWNGLANRVADRDLASLSQFQRSVLRMAATEHFARHLTNWEELIGRLISIIKGDGADLAVGPPPVYLQAVLASITAEDPRFLTRIFNLFVSAPAWQEEWRNVHPVKWKLDDGTELAFHGDFANWSEYDGMWAFDWHAADAPTARWVQSQLVDRTTGVTPPPAPPFSEVVASERAAARLSRRALAERSGVSAATIAAYETGRRSPSRSSLLALGRALTVDGYTTNRLLRTARFEEEPSDWAVWISGHTPGTIFKGKAPARAVGRGPIFAAADALDWPCAILDDACHVVHVNPHARRLIDIGRWKALPGRPGPHLMQLMVSQQFRSQLHNWTAVAGVVLPGRLEVQLLGSTGGSSRAGVRGIAESLRKTEMAGLEQLFDVWANSEGFDSLRRPAVRFEWTTEAGDELAFNCVFTTWNAYDPYRGMNLFPADEATFAWLGRG